MKRIRILHFVDQNVVKAAARSAETEDDAEPDPINRIDYIDWVYRNKIAKQLPPSEDADMIDQS